MRYLFLSLMLGVCVFVSGAFAASKVRTESKISKMVVTLELLKDAGTGNDVFDLRADIWTSDAEGRPFEHHPVLLEDELPQATITKVKNFLTELAVRAETKWEVVRD